jgi:hypothetical protein
VGTLAGYARRAGNLAALVGAVCVAASAFLPLAVARQGPKGTYGGGVSLLPHWQGFAVLGLAAAAVLVLLFSQAGPIERISGSVGLIVIGLGSSAYVTHVAGQVDWCAVNQCPLTTSPQGGIPFRAAEPGVASEVAAMGGLLLVVSAVLLGALALAPTLKRRPVFDRTHPTWM